MPMNKIKGCNNRIKYSKVRLVGLLHQRYNAELPHWRYNVAGCYFRARRDLCNLFIELEWIKTATNLADGDKELLDNLVREKFKQ